MRFWRPKISHDVDFGGQENNFGGQDGDFGGQDGVPGGREAQMAGILGLGGEDPSL